MMVESKVDADQISVAQRLSSTIATTVHESRIVEMMRYRKLAVSDRSEDATRSKCHSGRRMMETGDFVKVREYEITLSFSTPFRTLWHRSLITGEARDFPDPRRLHAILFTHTTFFANPNGYFEVNVTMTCLLRGKTITEIATVDRHLLTPSFVSSPQPGNRAQSLPLAIVSFGDLILLLDGTTGIMRLVETGIGSEKWGRVDEEDQMIDENDGENEHQDFLRP
ncbi:hypothetical protein K443DRAFT_9844 [Laccaria amethystina LaAM-08-1]|uniref:Uncharacterized protein n=1 Tax=Laccaria amethystina LaAM-08-1 TaxID=1095629 RepID=A0A0C9XIY0_9AGAR|nr:hypothetical protein K443DRAFT_9844 [Laccaria amethystina LaAM-08-1]